jgi:uncharacterized protein with ACT and thioredoxin-like domain
VRLIRMRSPHCHVCMTEADRHKLWKKHRSASAKQLYGKEELGRALEVRAAAVLCRLAARGR